MPLCFETTCYYYRNRGAGWVSSCVVVEALTNLCPSVPCTLQVWRCTTVLLVMFYGCLILILSVLFLLPGPCVPELSAADRSLWEQLQRKKAARERQRNGWSTGVEPPSNHERGTMPVRQRLDTVHIVEEEDGLAPEARSKLVNVPPELKGMGHCACVLCASLLSH